MFHNFHCDISIFNELIYTRLFRTQMLEERFDSFSNETQKIGRERVENVNAIADQLIGSGHSDAATIAEWKDGLNDSWANLLELLETRKQVSEQHMVS